MSGSGLVPSFSASGTLAASGATDWFQLSEPFNIMLWGTWSGSVAVERKAPDGSAINCVMPDGTPSAFTANGVIAAPNVWERGAEYRLNATMSSGSLNWRISR